MNIDNLNLNRIYDYNEQFTKSDYVKRELLQELADAKGFFDCDIEEFKDLFESAIDAILEDYEDELLLLDDEPLDITSEQTCRDILFKDEYLSIPEVKEFNDSMESGKFDHLIY